MLKTPKFVLILLQGAFLASEDNYSKSLLIWLHPDASSLLPSDSIPDGDQKQVPPHQKFCEKTVCVTFSKLSPKCTLIFILLYIVFDPILLHCYLYANLNKKNESTKFKISSVLVCVLKNVWIHLDETTVKQVNFVGSFFFFFFVNWELLPIY